MACNLDFERKWCFWMDFSGTGLGETARRFCNVQEFWQEYKQAEAGVREMQFGGAVHMYEAGAAAEQGGCLTLVAKSARKSLRVWQFLLLSVVGETIPCSEDVRGVTIVARGHHNAIKVWLHPHATSGSDELLRAYFKKHLDSGDYFADRVATQTDEEAQEAPAPLCRARRRPQKQKVQFPCKNGVIIQSRPYLPEPEPCAEAKERHRLPKVQKEMAQDGHFLCCPKPIPSCLRRGSDSSHGVSDVDSEYEYTSSSSDSWVHRPYHVDSSDSH
eukprot:NODE_2254_length_1464_cov_215.609247_g1271_i1.p1 GENE.NODE_2254_length_1464_cov_215.609247_g1271_i1~~NODE_2254_length_1464_cov_215.609247_g1271_i1.p1  ORF type:complete len:273 (+),score=49.82 NODE_2254_length_1464_cov_215.609247_g1271_i1:95-913(+)